MTEAEFRKLPGIETTADSGPLTVGDWARCAVEYIRKTRDGWFAECICDVLRIYGGGLQDDELCFHCQAKHLLAAIGDESEDDA